MSILFLALTFAIGGIVGLIGNSVLRPLKLRHHGLPWKLQVAAAALALFLLPALALGISGTQE